jgi:hypothetical protein
MKEITIYNADRRKGIPGWDKWTDKFIVRESPAYHQNR